MQIIQKLLSTLKEMGQPVHYGTAEELNEKLDNSPYPAIFVERITDTSFIQVGWQQCEQLSCRIFFINRTSYDFDSIENEAIIEECKATADQWQENIKHGNIFRKIGTQNYRRIYLEFLGYFTGIGYQCYLLENNGTAYCYPPPANPDGHNPIQP